MTISAYAATLVESYDYTNILAPQDFPTAQYYPQINTILSDLITYLQTVEPLLETEALNTTLPSTLSYGALTGYVTQGQSLCQKISALSPCPTLFLAEFDETVRALESMLLYPEYLQP